MILLAPGVQPSEGSPRSALYGRSASFSVSGARPEGQAELLDGANIQGYWNRGSGASIIGTSLGIEGIAEFQTLTGIYGAQFGGNGSVINAVTRSGTNDIHGSVYDFIRNSVFDTRNYFDPLTGPPSFRRNQFGAAVGFPISKNRTFGFFNYEGVRQQLGEVLLRSTQTTFLYQTMPSYTLPGMFDEVASTTTSFGSNEAAAQTNYGFDETARQPSGLAGTPGVQLSAPLFNVFGHVTSKTQILSNGSGPVSHWTYYDSGTPFQQIDANGNIASTSTFSALYGGALPTSVSNALGQTTTITYRADTGQKQSVKDPNGATTTYTNLSDPMNRTTAVVNPDGGETDIMYNDFGEQVGATVSMNLGTVSMVTQRVVDGLGRDRQTIVLSDPAGPDYTYVTHDELGRKAQVWNPSRCNRTLVTACPAGTTWGLKHIPMMRCLGRLPPKCRRLSEATVLQRNSLKRADELSCRVLANSAGLGRCR